MSYKSNDDNRVRTTGGGLGLGSVLGVVFIVLKLVGVIDWPWVWVLAPFWITLILGVIGIIIAIIFVIGIFKKEKFGRW